MLQAVLSALVEQRDAGQLILNKESVSDALILNSVVSLHQDARLSDASR